MKAKLKIFALVVIAVNVGLVFLSAAMAWQSTFRYPMQGTLVAAGNDQLHVIDSANTSSTTEPDGDKPVIVLIHGASTSSYDYSTNLHPRLSENFRVVSIDRPGHGYSERGDAIANTDPARQASMILDALHTMDISNPVLVGHSWAGSVVMAALLNEHPHTRVRAGILIAGATHPWTGGSAWHVELSAKPLTGTMFRWQFIEPVGRLMLEGAVASAFVPETVPDNYVDNTALTLSLRPTTYKYNALDVTRLSNYLEDQAPRYNQVTLPLLSIASTTDPIVPAWNHHDRLLKQIKHIQSLSIADAGHAPHHTRTDLVVDRISTFVRSLGP